MGFQHLWISSVASSVASHGSLCVSARPPLAWTNRQWSQPGPSPRSNAFPWPWHPWHPSGPWRRPKVGGNRWDARCICRTNTATVLAQLLLTADNEALNIMSSIVWSCFVCHLWVSFSFDLENMPQKSRKKVTKENPQKKTELVDLNPLSQHSTASDFPLLVRTRLRCNSWPPRRPTCVIQTRQRRDDRHVI